jgi:hypothetical protein
VPGWPIPGCGALPGCGAVPDCGALPGRGEVPDFGALPDCGAVPGCGEVAVGPDWVPGRPWLPGCGRLPGRGRVAAGPDWVPGRPLTRPGRVPCCCGFLPDWERPLSRNPGRCRVLVPACWVLPGVGGAPAGTWPAGGRGDRRFPPTGPLSRAGGSPGAGFFAGGAGGG